MTRPLLLCTALFAAAVLVRSLKQEVHVCPSGTTKVGDKCYFVTLGVHTGLDALEYCQEKNGHPAVVENQQEMDLLAGALLETSVFIGINLSNRTQIVESILLSSGHSGYTNFYEDEPNNSGGEDCVVAQKHQDFRWEDVSCNSTYQVLCETAMINVAVKKCGPEEHMFEEESCYWVSPTSNYTWLEADVLCKTRSMNLASVHSAREHVFLSGFIPKITWIGLNDIAVEDNFVWSDSTALDFQGWCDGQPDNAGFTPSENCVIMEYNTRECDYGWNDCDCRFRESVLCKGPTR